MQLSKFRTQSLSIPVSVNKFLRKSQKKLKNVGDRWRTTPCCGLFFCSRKTGIVVVVGVDFYDSSRDYYIPRLHTILFAKHGDGVLLPDPEDEKRKTDLPESGLCLARMRPRSGVQHDDDDDDDDIHTCFRHHRRRRRCHHRRNPTGTSIKHCLRQVPIISANCSPSINDRIFKSLSLLLQIATTTPSTDTSSSPPPPPPPPSPSSQGKPKTSTVVSQTPPSNCAMSHTHPLDVVPFVTAAAAVAAAAAEATAAANNDTPDYKLIAAVAGASSAGLGILAATGVLVYFKVAKPFLKRRRTVWPRQEVCNNLFF